MERGEQVDVDLGEDPEVLTEDELVRRLRIRSGRTELLAAIGAAVPSHAWEVESLLDLLRRALTAREPEIDLFAGFLEAPRSIIDLYQSHGRRLKSLESERDRTVDAFVDDVAHAVVRAAGEPLHWDALIRHGAVR